MADSNVVKLVLIYLVIGGCLRHVVVEYKGLKNVLFDTSNDNAKSKIHSSPNNMTIEEETSANISSNDAIDCTKVRGVYGEWIVDDNYARQVQYIPLDGFRQQQWIQKQQKATSRKKKTVVINNVTEFLPQTRYAWKETRYPQCQPQIFTKSGFCSVLQRLDITNVYMVGDSMMRAQWMSLVGMLGFRKKDKVTSYMQVISCPSGYTFTLTRDRSRLASIPPPPNDANVTVRIDTWGFDSIQVIPEYGQVGISQCPVEPASQRIKLPASKRKYKSNNGACPWIDEYSSLEGRTLLILNQGAAYHATKTFELMFDTVLEALDNTTKRNDIAFFRSVSAGHGDCFNHSRYQDKAPLSSFDEYLELAETTKYSWNLFRHYNAYVESRLKQHKTGYPLRYLNIFNISALRNDGHTAANDCLHYEMPSVVDWWNHLLYSNLLDIASKEEEERRGVE